MPIAFEHIVIIVLENTARSTVLQNQYFRDLRSKGVMLTNYYGVTHPSQPNYIAMVGGDTLTFWHDIPGYARIVIEAIKPDGPQATSIADLLEAKGLTWKSYAENLPLGYNKKNAQCLKSNQGKAPDKWTFPEEDPDGSGLFSRKHVPFLSFPNIIADADRYANIVNAEQLDKDLANGDLPNYSFYTPNMLNDGHNDAEGVRTPFDRADNVVSMANFLQGLLGGEPLEKLPPETLIVVTFDEAYPYHAPNRIYTLLIGDMLPPGTSIAEPYNHYSLLRSVEVNFHLGTLGRNDAVARPFWFLRS